MIHSEKHLCTIGKALEAEWDNAIENYKQAKLETNKDKVYQAAKSYFYHRRECSDCSVKWKYESINHEAKN